MILDSSTTNLNQSITRHLSQKNLFMKTTILKIGIVLCLLSLMGTGCDKKEDFGPESTNVKLRDKPLSVIQHYITGDWKLQYAVGGLSAQTFIDTANTYMTLSSTHILIGNDSGVLINSSIKWVKKYDTYVLDYSYPEGVHYPYIIESIKNDSLIITEDAGDGFTYFYTHR